MHSFQEVMRRLGVEKQDEQEGGGIIGALLGLPVLVRKYVPKDEAWMMHNGKIIQRYKF